MLYDGEWKVPAVSVKAEKTEDNLVTYPGIFEDTDLQCRVHGEGLKEDIILHSPEAVREEYAMLYQMEETPLWKITVYIFWIQMEKKYFVSMHHGRCSRTKNRSNSVLNQKI